ncbi:MAG: dephospho-CoA kinase [Bifidobacteriaceae bacterium]|nr:dephospho-CoA kinase [Bifidobacteriaceae bacterium]
MALTGGLAAGKSTVAGYLRDAGFNVVDSDELARLATAPGTACLAEIARAFGASIIRPDGQLKRAELARIVFRDPSLRRLLESIIHPVVRQATQAALESASLAGRSATIVDIPLLVETGRAGDYDLVVTVSAPEEVRLGRAVARGYSLDQARSRLAAQASDRRREAVADIVLDGSKDVSHLLDETRRRLIPRLAG